MTTSNRIGLAFALVGTVGCTIGAGRTIFGWTTTDWVLLIVSWALLLLAFEILVLRPDDRPARSDEPNTRTEDT